MKPVKLFDQFVNEGLHSKLKKARKEMEKAFKNKGVTIDVQDLGTDSGFFITYDNISKEELLKIAQSVDNKWKYHVSNPIKSQETGHYLIVDLTRDVEAIDEASYEDPIKKKAEKRYKDHGGSVRISGIGKPFEQIKTTQSMPTVMISKKEYDKLKSTGRVSISRIASGLNLHPSPQTYKTYPKGQYEIIVKNPYTKKNEVFFSKTSHDANGVYFQITELD